MIKQSAFTLIELMIVVAILGILSTMAMPTFQARIVRTQIEEASIIANELKKEITDFYKLSQNFPANNQQAHLPEANYLIGNYVTKVEILDGAIHVHLGNKINANVKDKILSFRPAVVENSPESPIAWLCGYSKAVKGMKAIGINKTNVPPFFLDMNCRV